MPTLQDLFGELTGGDDQRAEKAVQPIVDFGEAALPELLKLTRSAVEDERWWAVRVLGASPHTRTADLLPLLEDSAPQVRAAAAFALGAHADQESIAALVNALADEDSLTAGLAGNALAKIGSSAVLSLLKIKQEAPLRVRILALRALAEIKDYRAVSLFMKSLSAESTVLQYWAEIGLERLGLDMVYIKP
ncbi:MAG: HEAT repeat domain-containing protein [Anaerolineales bacterium]|nr:HEAT repeat domain-containing protein [Anaerolineales bacterium]MCZ2121036.1 HEAT repeat domain-containing protein [Anaerolineales bacterium]